jgi:hypothetical protein
MKQFGTIVSISVDGGISITTVYEEDSYLPSCSRENLKLNYSFCHELTITKTHYCMDIVMGPTVTYTGNTVMFYVPLLSRHTRYDGRDNITVKEFSVICT